MIKSAVGLSSKRDNFTLKPLKKMHYKAFEKFSKEYDGEEITLDSFLEMQASKEFLFFQTGKLWLYLFEVSGKTKFETGEILGYAEITPSSQNDASAEVGYFLKESCRGKGFGKIMLGMAIEICKNMGFQEITAVVNCDNVKSIGVLKSGNFQISQSENGKCVAKLQIKNINQSIN